jgi:L-rhamnose mutarotase
MIRRAFRMSVHRGQEQEYLDRATNDLFAYVEFENEERWDAVAATDVCRRWRTHMHELMPSRPDHRPISVALDEVFHIDAES